MPNDRVTDLLAAFSAVTADAPHPESPARRAAMRTSLPAATLAGGVLIVAVIAIAGVMAGRPDPTTGPGASPTASAVPIAVVSAVPSVTPSAEPSVAPTAPPTPAPTVEPTIGACDVADLHARITLWEGAAGSRIAHVELVNDGSVACLLEARAHPQLVAGDGSVLIDGTNPTTTTVLTLEPGAKVTTLVSAANYCGPEPVPPVSVAFVRGDHTRIVAAPETPTDATTPDCLGPGQPGSIDMHPWAA